MNNYDIMDTAARHGARLLVNQDQHEMVCMRPQDFFRFVRSLQAPEPGCATSGGLEQYVPEIQPVGYVSTAALHMLREHSKAIIYWEPTVTATHALYLLENK